MVNFPFASAVVAFLVPVSVTVANGTGAPVSSFTVPVTVRPCENANTPLSISTVKSVRNLLMCLFNFFKIFKNSYKNKKLIFFLKPSIFTIG
jgi:hypothetical protein